MKLPLEFPSNRLTELLPRFATARSSLPSPFTSLSTTETGPVPVSKVCWGVNVPFPFPSNTLTELREIVSGEIAANRTELDSLTTQVVATGLATWTGDGPKGMWGGSLIVRGQARLLSDVTEIERLAAIQALFERLETQETMLRLLDLAESSEGVRIFIGAESGLFGTTGVSMVVAPARGEGGRIVGAIGVIGPTRINYGRIIPVVDYTARVIGRLLG